MGNDWEERHREAKEQVGMAIPGTPEYERNAAIVLSVHAGQGMRQETRQKHKYLARRQNSPASLISQQALRESSNGLHPADDYYYKDSDD